MGLQIGIVGLPNVGKSTLFKALTKKEVLIENYPFATIDPNVGIVQVPDERLELLTKMSNSQKTVPTVIEFVDIAGLVQGAHKGEGLGNQFLSNIREVDAIIHLVRAFSDDNVHHVDGSIDPERDEDTIKIELIMADLATIDKRIAAVEPKTKTGDKELLEQLALFKKAKELLETEKWLASESWTVDETKLLHYTNLLTMKPVIHILNTKQHEDISIKLDNFIEIDVKEELELSGLSKEERDELNIQETGLEKLIKLSYEILELNTFLTTGEKESRAWTVNKGAQAPQAAGVIHTDFEKGFIKAEVINWQDLLENGSWSAARDSGKLRLEGKEYVVQDGDVIVFKV